MTGIERALLAHQLRDAANKMAGRYGIACMEIAQARPGTDAHAAAHRTAIRQYRALMRLTFALSALAAGGPR